MYPPPAPAVTSPVHGHLVGEGCPPFEVHDTFGDLVTERDLVGGPALIVFYPFSFTPICDEELTELEDRVRDFDDVAILVISCDPVASVRAWQEHKDFSFAMASDFWPHGLTARAFGVFDEATGHGRRASFVLRADGTITWSVINPPGAPRAVDPYLEALEPHRGPARDGKRE